MVVPLFEGIKNTNSAPLKFDLKDHPWGPDQLKKQLHVVNGYNAVQLVFAVPDVYYEQYQNSVRLSTLQLQMTFCFHQYYIVHISS